LIWISPQLGQRNFVDSLPGGIGFPQLVHVTKDSFSDITVTLLCEVFGGVPYNCYAQKMGLDAAFGFFRR
jgi:hypothetical protein